LSVAKIISRIRNIKIGVVLGYVLPISIGEVFQILFFIDFPKGIKKIKCWAAP